MSIDKLKTKFTTGAWLIDVKHFFKKINEIIDALNGIINGSTDVRPYKSYVAKLTSNGPGALDVVVLENNTDLVFTSNAGLGAGNYFLNTPGGSFLGSQAHVMLQNQFVGNAFISVDVQDDQINLMSVSGTLVPSDGVFINTSIELRIYE